MPSRRARYIFSIAKGFLPLGAGGVVERTQKIISGINHSKSNQMRRNKIMAPFKALPRGQPYQKPELRFRLQIYWKGSCLPELPAFLWQPRTTGTKGLQSSRDRVVCCTGEGASWRPGRKEGGASWRDSRGTVPSTSPCAVGRDTKRNWQGASISLISSFLIIRGPRSNYLILRG